MTTPAHRTRQVGWAAVITALALLAAACSAKIAGRPAGAIPALEAKIGRQFSADRIYTNMTNELPTNLDLAVQKAGWLDYHNINSWHFVGIQKECYAWSDIAAGTYDQWLTQQAKSLKAWGYPIYMSFQHEPTVDTATHPKCGTAAEFVAAYDHIVELFDANHVTNVTWVWALTSSNFGGAKGGPEAWEPHHYDVVGVDGYNHSDDWRTPQEIFQAAEDFATKVNKPLLIAEIGSDEQPGNPNGKADWITQAAALFQSWGNVPAVIWTNTNNGGNYWFDSSPQALAAFKAAGLAPYYQVKSNHFVDGGAIWGIYSGLNPPA
jgi:hypothetical protein